MPLRLRIEGDPDDPAMWHPIAVVHDDMLQDVVALSIEFHDGTPEKLYNDIDSVEFTVQAPNSGPRFI
ncbi:hypothetical protein AWC15_11255 [Mycobacterium lacus]|nr:hypothetical protein AWC15_11255 [Mycobacterium lacus]